MPRLYLIQNSLAIKSAENFLNISGIKIEYIAARQWYGDLFSASEEASNIINPLAQKSKELQERVNALGKDEIPEELLVEHKKVNDELNQAIQAEVPVNIVTLRVLAKNSLISVASYICLEQLHNFKLINCDLFESK